MDPSQDAGAVVVVVVVVAAAGSVVVVTPVSASEGTLRVVPLISIVSALIPFQEARVSVERPLAAAIPERVSPSTTVWVTAARASPPLAARASEQARVPSAIRAPLPARAWCSAPVRMFAGFALLFRCPSRYANRKGSPRYRPPTLRLP